VSGGGEGGEERTRGAGGGSRALRGTACRSSPVWPHLSKTMIHWLICTFDTAWSAGPYALHQ
jgi:hypothetical protein